MNEEYKAIHARLGDFRKEVWNLIKEFESDTGLRLSDSPIIIIGRDSMHSEWLHRDDINAIAVFLRKIQ